MCKQKHISFIRDVQGYQNQNGFRSHECMWIPSERLKPVFHQVFIWHLIGKEDSHSEDEHSSPIWKSCVRWNHWWKHGLTCVKAKRARFFWKNPAQARSITSTEWHTKFLLAVCLLSLSYGMWRHSFERAPALLIFKIQVLIDSGSQMHLFILNFFKNKRQ